MVISLQTAEALGLEVPPSLLGREESSGVTAELFVMYVFDLQADGVKR